MIGILGRAHVTSLEKKVCHPPAETSMKSEELRWGVNTAKMAPCLLREVAVSPADDSSWQRMCFVALLLRCSAVSYPNLSSLHPSWFFVFLSTLTFPPSAVSLFALWLFYFPSLPLSVFVAPVSLTPPLSLTSCANSFPGVWV